MSTRVAACEGGWFEDPHASNNAMLMSPSAEARRGETEDIDFMRWSPRNTTAARFRPGSPQRQAAYQRYDVSLRAEEGEA
jgi:hypothetical protein